MKPLGRKMVKFPSKTDHRIKGFMNWWEDIAEPCKQRERQTTKKEIREIKRTLSNIMV